MMWVKICGIKRVEDAIAAVQFGTDAIGFVFAESPRMVAIDEAERISREVGDSVLKVGVFSDSPIDVVKDVARRCRLDLVQFHGSESPEYCEEFGGMAIKAIRIRDDSIPFGISAYKCFAVLLDARPGIDKEPCSFDWSLARSLSGKVRLIIAGGLNPLNVAKLIRNVRPFGVDASSGVEISPGVKDKSLMKEFIREAKGALC